MNEAAIISARDNRRFIRQRHDGIVIAKKNGFLYLLSEPVGQKVCIFNARAVPVLPHGNGKRLSPAALVGYLSCISFSMFSRSSVVFSSGQPRPSYRSHGTWGTCHFCPYKRGGAVAVHITGNCIYASRFHTAHGAVEQVNLLFVLCQIFITADDIADIKFLDA